MTTIEHDPLETEERRHAARVREEEARARGRVTRAEIERIDKRIAETEEKVAAALQRRQALVEAREAADLEAAQALDEVEAIDAAERARGAS